MAEEHGVARGPDYHADHGEPNIGHALWRVSTVSYAQHVTHGHKQSVGVLDVPCRVLKRVVNNEASETEQEMRSSMSLQLWENTDSCQPFHIQVKILYLVKNTVFNEKNNTSDSCISLLNLTRS